MPLGEANGRAGVAEALLELPDVRGQVVLLAGKPELLLGERLLLRPQLLGAELELDVQLGLALRQLAFALFDRPLANVEIVCLLGQRLLASRKAAPVAFELADGVVG